MIVNLFAPFEFVRHLDTSWRDLAEILEIPSHEQAAFDKGHEPRGIWRWLSARGRLGALPAALREIDRGDLVSAVERHRAPGTSRPEQETPPSPMPASIDGRPRIVTKVRTHHSEAAWRQLYHKVRNGADSPDLEVIDVDYAQGARINLEFIIMAAAPVAKGAVTHRMIDESLRLLTSGRLLRMCIFVVGPMWESAHATASQWLDNTLPDRVDLEGVKDDESLMEMMAMKIHDAIKCIPRRQFDDDRNDLRIPGMGDF